MEEKGKQDDVNAFYMIIALIALVVIGWFSFKDSKSEEDILLKAAGVSRTEFERMGNAEHYSTLNIGRKIVEAQKAKK